MIKIEYVHSLKRPLVNRSSSNMSVIECNVSVGVNTIVVKRADNQVMVDRDHFNRVVHWDVEVMKIYVLNGVIKPSEYTNAMLRAFVEVNDFDMMLMILNANNPGIDKFFDDNLIFARALQYGHIALVKHMMADPDVKPCDRNELSIAIASRYGQTEIVKLLLEDEHVNASANNNKAMKNASSNRHVETAMLLIEHDSYQKMRRAGMITRPRVNGTSLPVASDHDRVVCRFRTAAATGDYETVRKLLSDPSTNPAAASCNPNEKYVGETGGDSYYVRALYSEPIATPPQFKPFVICNTLPRFDR
jgi:Ankyrin repeats (3 copies)